MKSKIPLSSAILKANTGADAIKKAPIVNHDTGVKCLRIGDLSNNRNYREWGFTEVEDKHYENFKLLKDDIFIARTGNTIGVNSIIKTDNVKAVFNNGMIRLRVDKSSFSPMFIYYIISSSKMQDYIQSIAYGTSTQPNMKINDLLRYEFVNLKLEEQKKIAHILSTLDDKIELNRKMNQTLEEMAQALFKSWFVDFDPVHARAKCSRDEELETAAKELGISKEILDLFPSEFEESELGMIPKGWEVNVLQDIISVKDGTHDSPKPKKEGYPLVTSKHIKNGEIELVTPNLISKEDYDKVNQRSRVEQFDILIGMIGTIGDLYFVSDKQINYAIKNVGLFKTSEVKELSEYIYYWLDTKYMRDYIINRLAGTTQKYISLTELRKLPIVLPSHDILVEFKKLVELIMTKKKNNFNNTQTLQKTRDTLLPKLLSGELDVSELELDIEGN